MTPARKKRLALIIALVALVSTATAFMLKAFDQNVMFFYSASEVSEGKAPENRKFRLGGMVKTGSIDRDHKSLLIRFDVTDNVDTVTVEYTGILPDLFSEGKGVVANGRLRNDGVFIADEVLAKHDENYMPPEVAASMKPKTATPNKI
jgi:cytochrome c-type biogenesis protein CcmE